MKPLDRLLFLQGGLCFFCKKALPVGEASVEHLCAKSNGGPSHDENCVACCKELNAWLGNMSVKEKFRAVLAQRGNFICPRIVVSKAKKPEVGAGVPSETVADTKGDLFTVIVENLRKSGNSRPGSLKTLTSTVTALLPKGVDAREASSIVDRLQSSAIVSVDGTKVRYSF